MIPPTAGSSQREPGYVMAQIREVVTREPGTYRSAPAVVTVDGPQPEARWSWPRASCVGLQRRFQVRAAERFTAT